MNVILGDGTSSVRSSNSQVEVHYPVSLSVSSADVSHTRRQRPLSFSGGDVDEMNNKTLQMSVTPGDRSSASLIAETLQQIDQLGVELDSYCMNLNSQQDVSSGVGSSVVSSLEQNGSSHRLDSPVLSNSATVTSNTPVATPPTYRNFPSTIQHPPSQVSMSSVGSIGRNRPPPPARRNSQIQSASTFAPSIADLRTLKQDYGTIQHKEPPRYQGPTMTFKQPPPPPAFPTHLFNK